MNIALRRWIQFKDRYVESEYLFPSKTYKTKIRVSNFEANFRNYCARVDIKLCKKSVALCGAVGNTVNVLHCQSSQLVQKILQRRNLLSSPKA